jgi:hypothetical protein
MLDARRLWIEANTDQRRRLQDALFPRGVTYSTKAGFGTAETGLFFRLLPFRREIRERRPDPFAG